MDNGAARASAPETPVPTGAGNKRQAEEIAGVSAKKAKTDAEEHTGACLFAWMQTSFWMTALLVRVSSCTLCSRTMRDHRAPKQVDYSMSATALLTNVIFFPQFLGPCSLQPYRDRLLPAFGSHLLCSSYTSTVCGAGHETPATDTKKSNNKKRAFLN